MSQTANTSQKETSNPILNFGPGPSKLPPEVVRQLQQDLVNFEGSGLGIGELSHRSTLFDAAINRCAEQVRRLLNVPANYRVLFMAGGGTGQFAAVPMNLVQSAKVTQSLKRQQNDVVDYAVTGGWSQKAFAEAQKLLDKSHVNSCIGQDKTAQYTEIPDASEWSLTDLPAFFFYCDNETIHGMEFAPEQSPPSRILELSKCGAKFPIVCDMSSNIFTRPIDFSKFGMIFAGAQKNMGCAGVTLVIIREDLLAKSATPDVSLSTQQHLRFPTQRIPTVFDYEIVEKNRSLQNTPCTLAICSMLRVFEWIEREGGVPAMQERSRQKSQLLYDFIDNECNGFYRCPVKRHCRSRMNIVFRIGKGDAKLEQELGKAADAAKIISLKGHRSVSGFRASLYNAITLEEVKRLIDFLRAFAEKNQ